MEPLVWDGFAIGIGFQVKCSPVDKLRDEAKDALTYELRLDRLGATGEYRIGLERLGNYWKFEQKQMQQPFKFLERHGLSAKIFDEQQQGLAAPEENVPP